MDSSTEMPLKGKTAVITGASRGIGFAIAKRIGALGARLCICARDEVRLSSAVESLRSHGIDATGKPADMKSPDSIAAFAEFAIKTFASPDILVNNAGIGIFRPAHELTLAEWDEVLDTNLSSVFLMCRAFVPDMIKHGGGDIVNIASLAGKNAFTGGAAYCASKWGLLGFTHSMAEDLRDYGIRVSAVCPGSVATDFMHGTKRDTSKMLQAEDVAHAVGMILTQGRNSFLSEVSLRPARKP